MDRSQQYRIHNLPGMWQYWGDAAPTGMWVIPADEQARDHLRTHGHTGSFLRVEKSLLQPGPPDDDVRLF